MKIKIIRKYGKKEKYDVEFVSANPTGDLHLGHTRGAALGDATANLYKKAGYDVTKEYYINDCGNQVAHLGWSIRCRYHELFGEKCELGNDDYHGVSLIKIAEAIKEQYGDKYLVDNDESKVGLFGSIDYIGRAFGAIIFSIIMGVLYLGNKQVSPILEGQGGSSEWELLIDNTTTDNIAQWIFTQGEQGQVFNDYNELMIYVIAQPRTDGATAVTTYSAKVRSGSAWNAPGAYSIGNTTSLTATTYSVSVLKKTPIGIVPYVLASYNNSNQSCNLAIYSSSRPSLISGLLAQGQVHLSTEDNIVRDFDQVQVGSYTPIFGPDSRLQVFGRK